MKKTRSAIIYPLLCSAVMLPAVMLPAILSPLAFSSAARAAEASDAVEAGSVEAGAMAQQETASADSASSAAAVPELILSKCFLLESDNYESIADGYFQAILLAPACAKQYPQLAASLTQLNKEIASSCRESFKELSDKTRQYLAGTDISDGAAPSATLESNIVPVRQDEKAVSFFTAAYSHIPGAVSATTTFRGYTLDSADGHIVTLEQVLADRENRGALAAAVSANLRFTGTGVQAGGRDESVSVALASEETFPAWVVSNDGVIFRFNPGVIGSEEEGALEAEVRFGQYPDLFSDAYAAHKGSYTLPINTVYPVMADLDGDGTTEKVSLNARPSEDGEKGSYTALRVALGDKECLHETYFFNARGVLLHTGAGKNYLYVQSITDNDYRILSVFDLNGETPVFKGEINGTGFTARYRRDSSDADLWYLDEQFISSPESFFLDSHMDLMSTYSASRRYKVGDDGMPSALTDVYEIDSDLVLTSLTDLPADIVDADSGDVAKQSSVLPRGTKCSLYRTNGIDSVDVKAEDGTIYRFTVTGDWPQMVNGLRLDQAFEGTMFAG